MTLKRIIRKGEENWHGFQKAQVSTPEEELRLSDYFIHQASRINYGLPLKKLRELAYEFAKANNRQFPPSWDLKKMAGKD